MNLNNKFTCSDCCNKISGYLNLNEIVNMGKSCKDAHELFLVQKGEYRNRLLSVLHNTLKEIGLTDENQRQEFLFQLIKKVKVRIELEDKKITVINVSEQGVKDINTTPNFVLSHLINNLKVGFEIDKGKIDHKIRDFLTVESNSDNLSKTEKEKEEAKIGKVFVKSCQTGNINTVQCILQAKNHKKTQKAIGGIFKSSNQANASEHITHGCEALISCIRNKNQELAELLISQDLDLNIIKAGLEEAIKNHQIEFIEMLLIKEPALLKDALNICINTGKVDLLKKILDIKIPLNSIASALQEIELKDFRIIELLFTNEKIKKCLEQPEVVLSLLLKAIEIKDTKAIDLIIEKMEKKGFHGIDFKKHLNVAIQNQQNEIAEKIILKFFTNFNKRHLISILIENLKSEDDIFIINQLSKLKNSLEEEGNKKIIENFVLDLCKTNNIQLLKKFNSLFSIDKDIYYDILKNKQIEDNQIRDFLITNLTESKKLLLVTEAVSTQNESLIERILKEDFSLESKKYFLEMAAERNSISVLRKVIESDPAFSRNPLSKENRKLMRHVRKLAARNNNLDVVRYLNERYQGLPMICSIQ